MDGFLEDTDEYWRVRFMDLDANDAGGKQILARSTCPMLVSGSDERAFLLAGADEDDRACEQI